jgi:threonine dehydrogenase-like Zn-dependent dehydrogenase
MAEPDSSEGPVLVEGLLVGICGTDGDIVNAATGRTPSNSDFLVLGHEGLGRVISSDAPEIAVGDHVVGFVRRPDPVPCPACAVGEWDMCRNGRYTSHGISGRHGFARERWRAGPDGLVRVDLGLKDLGVLVEPASVVAKAWQQIEHVGRRGYFAPRAVVVTGAGPVGLLAAMMGVHRGLDVHVVDIVTSGPKPDLVADLGATYHSSGLSDVRVEADIVIECTGAPAVIMEVLRRGGPATVTCLMGMSPEATVVSVDVAGFNQRLVRQNGVVVGSVNANRRHYEAAVAALAEADFGWLSRLISREVPLLTFADAFERRPDDIKVVLRLAS